MNQTSQIKKYIYTWLEGLNIGHVIQDRKPMDNTTKSRASRTYISFFFDKGIDDMGGFFQGDCTVIITARDIVRFTSPESYLAQAEAKLLAEFDKNDTVNGISLIGIDKVDDGPDEEGNHEYVYVFTVLVEKGNKGISVNNNPTN